MFFFKKKYIYYEHSTFKSREVQEYRCHFRWLEPVDHAEEEYSAVLEVFTFVKSISYSFLQQTTERVSTSSVYLGPALVIIYSLM